MQIINLASGSSGNSTFVSFNGTKILIDAGITEKKLKERLAEIDETLDDISAVLVTHEHIDHIKALKTISKRQNIKFFMHKNLKDSSYFDDGYNFFDENVIAFENDGFDVGDLRICPISISHDAISPVAFVINAKNSKSKVAFLTDTGIVTDEIKSKLFGVKMIFIESNYDEKMIDNGPYPYVIRQRIKGEKGHLSNSQSLELAKELFLNKTKCFVLSHISQNNNTYEKAFENYVNYFESQGYEIGKDVQIKVSFADKHGNKFLLREEYNED